MEMDARREAGLLDEAERNYKQKYENLKGLMYQQKVNQAIVQAWFIGR